MQRKSKFLVPAALAFSLAGPALAVLGVGDIVFDPTNYGKLVAQLLQMQKEYAELVQTYKTVSSQYQQMLFMARQDPVNMILRYRAVATPWLNSSATNTYGTTAGWTTGINTGLGAAAGYGAATQP